MSTALNLTGQRFGRLVVLSRNYEKQYEIYKRSGTQNAYWNCQYDCGSLTRHEAEKQYHRKWSGENNKRDYEKIMGVS